jgi:hypothetical protein
MRLTAGKKFKDFAKRKSIEKNRNPVIKMISGTA